MGYAKWNADRQRKLIAEKKKSHNFLSGIWEIKLACVCGNFCENCS